jgi:hypothetical protein
MRLKMPWWFWNLFGEQALGLGRILTNAPCPLYPGKQISPRATAVSAKCHKRTSLYSIT